jgi:hypothetical protein
MYGVTYGNGTFVAVGNTGAIQTSSDGTTWTNRTTANTNQQNGVGYGNGTFVAVGDNGAIQTSIDNGITWTNRTTANTNQQYGVGYDNGIFVAVGNTGSIQTSEASITYNTSTEFKTPPFNTKFSPYDNGYGQNTYIYMKT